MSDKSNKTDSIEEDALEFTASINLKDKLEALKKSEDVSTPQVSQSEASHTSFQYKAPPPIVTHDQSEAFKNTAPIPGPPPEIQAEQQNFYQNPPSVQPQYQPQYQAHQAPPPPPPQYQRPPPPISDPRYYPQERQNSIISQDYDLERTLIEEKARLLAAFMSESKIVEYKITSLLKKLNSNNPQIIQLINEIKRVLAEHSNFRG